MRKQRAKASKKRKDYLKRKGRADWKAFKKAHPQVALERVDNLKHFRSI